MSDDNTLRVNDDGHYHFTSGSMHHEDDCTPYCPLNGFRDDYGAFGGTPVSVTLAAEDGTLSDITNQSWKLPVCIPVTEEGLADAGLLGPPGPSLIQRWLDTHQQRTPEELAAERETRKAAAEQAQTAAVAEWETLRAKFTDTPQGNVLRALLNVHQPELYTYTRGGPVCGYCDQIGGPEREGVDWPCVNYEIIRDGIG